MSNNTAIYIYVVLSIIAIGILIGFLLRCENKNCSNYTDWSPDPWTGQRLRSYFDRQNNKKRNMCLCSSGGVPLCANRQELLSTYDEGNTEYQDFAGKQKQAGGPFWHNTNFMPCC